MQFSALSGPLSRGHPSSLAVTRSHSQQTIGDK